MRARIPSVSAFAVALAVFAAASWYQFSTKAPGRPAESHDPVPRPPGLLVRAPGEDPALTAPPARAAAPVLEVLLEAPSFIEPGRPATARIAAFATTGPAELAPAPGEPVQVSVLAAGGQPAVVFTGVTGPDGRVDATFTVPAGAGSGCQMQVVAGKGDGAATATASAQVAKEAEGARILLVADKPVYQPGQTVRLRALALDRDTLAAAKGSLTFEIDDCKGNKVFKKTVDLGEHGVAATDFELADEVLMGNWSVIARAGASRSEKTIVVKKYVLPKFKVAVEPDKTWYMPGDVVKGTVRADYFFGKPVAGGEVRVKAKTFDAQFHDLAVVTSRTNADGVAEFELTLPTTFVGQPLQNGDAYLRLDVEVKDTADHKESSGKSLPVAAAPFRLFAVPESGKLVPGVENVVYILATSPDGEPVVCDVTLAGAGVEAKGATDETGIAELRFTPGHMTTLPVELHGRTRAGLEGSGQAQLAEERGKDVVLLRADRAVAKAGETLKLEVLGTFAKTRVFVDAVRSGRAVAAASEDMKDGRAILEIAIPPNEFGALEIHAYAVLATGEIARDARVVHVLPQDGLRIDMKADREAWRPGETATVQFHVTGTDGKGVAAALGVVVVDESVYAVQDMQPGLERVFFTLAQELAEPRWGLKTQRGLAQIGAQFEAGDADQRIARVLLAPVEPSRTPASAKTVGERAARHAEKKALLWRTLGQWILAWKEPFYEKDTTGRPVWAAGLLRRIRADRRVKMGESLLTDPWGHEISMETLQTEDPVFRIDWWREALMWEALPALQRALVRLAADGRLVQDGRFAPDLPARLAAEGLESSRLRDGFGEPVSFEWLAAVDPAMSLTNLIKAGENEQSDRVLAWLRSHADKALEMRDGTWSFTAGVEGQVGLPQRRPDGSNLSLAALAAADPALAPEAIVTGARLAYAAEVWDAIAAKAQRDGWADVLEVEPGKGWKFRAGLLEGLLAAGSLRTLDLPLSGGRATLESLSAIDPSFRPDLLVAASLLQQVQAISVKVCEKIHRVNGALGADSIAELVRNGDLTESQGSDPWGSRLVFADLAAGESTPMGCGLLSGKKKVMSAGPDRAFGTPDDFRVDIVAAGSSPRDALARLPQPKKHGDVRLIARDAFLMPPQFRDILRAARRGSDAVLADDEPAIFFPDGDESDHNESGDMEYTAPKGDSVEFFSDKPVGAAGERPREVFPLKTSPGVYDAMGVGGGGRFGGRLGGRRNLVARGGGVAGPGGDVPEGIRVRNWFPETLLWKPLLVTGPDGRASLEVPLADSITTWRLSASAHAPDGRLGSATRGLLVFQPFFVDIDFPVALTQNDEVSVPVAVYNYLKEPQQVNLKVEKEDWFELSGEPAATLGLPAGEVKAAHFRIKVKGLGRRRLTVYAWGADEAARDAIRREVEVVPDGKMIEVVLNAEMNGTIKSAIPLPANAIPGTTKIFAKLHPGIASQVVEGVEGMLGMPHG